MDNNGAHEEVFNSIKASILLGRRIQKKVPGVAAAYRNLRSYREIVDEEGVMKGADITDRGVAERATAYAVKGFEGGYGLEAYRGLVSQEEASQLDDVRSFAISSRNSREKIRRGRGLTDRLGPEGIRRVTRAGLIAQGKTPPVEREYLHDRTILGEHDHVWLMMGHSDYRLIGPSGVSRNNIAKIAQDIDTMFYGGRGVRTLPKMRHIVFKVRKAKKKQLLERVHQK